MRYSHLFGKTTSNVTKKYDSISHELLMKAGYIDQVAAGIFSFLPLGKRVLARIESIIRDEMNTIGGQEIAMPALQPKAVWETTDRWNSVDDLFKIKSMYGKEYGLGPTHEEIVTPLAKKYVKSYRDLPLYLYQIAPKFRDEARAKSGILRGREFGMKDLYSFHENRADLSSFYTKVTDAYLTIFKRCGLIDVKITEASGGSFAKKYSHEFNVITPAGEVDLIYCTACNFAQNTEIAALQKGDVCPHCTKGSVQIDKAIEIGNIFDLGTRFSSAFDLTFTARDGSQQFPMMGCYGIGTTRLLGTVVEVNHDEKGILWNRETAPYDCHLINLSSDQEKHADAVYRTLLGKGFEVLYDDRIEISSGQKLMVADLIGIPIRLIVSDRTGRDIEWKSRTDKKTRMMTVAQVIEKLSLKS
ncbi:MAG TPA: aminoacyl--tRNA ligase-related protein [Patescibacteria group bacterium]|nr:aminoacyl--tRNA ligase-related protein [Patescibacteria group bacterium]